MSDEAIGEFEHLVMLSVVRLDEAYGGAIRRVLRERAGKEVSFGAIYSTLRRLEAKGWITSENRAPTDDPDARERKYVAMTKAGRAALEATRTRLEKMSEGLELA